MTAYQAENERLRQFVRAKLGEAEAAPRLEWCEARSKGEATDTDLTGGANARMINKYDYGLLEALKHARRSFVITDPTLPDNPIVFASGVLTASFEFTIRARGAAAASRRGGTPGRRRQRGLDPTRRSHTRTPSPRPGEDTSMAWMPPVRRRHEHSRARPGLGERHTTSHRRLPLAHGLQARAGFRTQLPIFAGSEDRRESSGQD